MSHKWFQKTAVKALFPYLCFLAGPMNATDIFQYHEDFHALLEKGKQLYQIPKKIDAITPNLDLEVEIFAAADIRASADLLYTSTSMLLQLHAALVDVFTETEYFKESHIRPSIETLLNNTDRVRLKCQRYMTVVKRPELFQQILNLDEIASEIDAKLGKYRPVVKPVPTATPTPPAAQAPVQEKNKAKKE